MWLQINISWERIHNSCECFIIFSPPSRLGLRTNRQLLNAALLRVMNRKQLCSTLYPTIPFAALPLSHQQQCLREVWETACEIHTHLLCFSPHLIFKYYLCEVHSYLRYIYAPSLSFIQQSNIVKCDFRRLADGSHASSDRHGGNEVRKSC